MATLECKWLGTSQNARKAMGVILACSVLLRVIVAFSMGDRVVDMPGTADQISYHELALRVLSGHGFSFDRNWWPMTVAGTPTAHWSFLYTFYLAAIYAIFGPHPLAARLIQAVVVGILHPYLAYLTGKIVFNEAVGLFTSAASAFYTYFIYYSGTLMTEPYYFCGILICLLLAIRLANSTDWKSGVGLGFAFGFVVLLRQLVLLIIPFIMIWMWWRRRALRGSTIIPVLLVSVVIMGLMILPFTIYNYIRFKQFVFLNTNAGYVLFWGNHPIYGTQFVPILPREVATYESLVPKELIGLDEAALEKELLKRGLQFIVDDPGRFVILSLSRIPVYFMFWPSPGSGVVSNLSRIAGFGLFLPFIIYGIYRTIRMRSLWEPDIFASPLFLLFLFGALYSFLHILTWTLIRYRLPVDTVFLVFSGVAWVCLLNRFAAGRKILRGLGLLSDNHQV